MSKKISFEITTEQEVTLGRLGFHPFHPCVYFQPDSKESTYAEVHVIVWGEFDVVTHMIYPNGLCTSERRDFTGDGWEGVTP